MFLINQLILANVDAGASVEPDFHSDFESDSFTIVSSKYENVENDMNVKKIGEVYKVNWLVYGKSGDKPVET